MGTYLEQAPKLQLPVLTGEDLHATVLAKKATSGGLDGWGWNELEALPMSWFVGLALIRRQVEDTGQWPDGLLDAYITMISKADGDSTPLGQRPLCVSQWFIAFGLGSVRSHSGLSMLGMPLLWILRRS